MAEVKKKWCLTTEMKLLPSTTVARMYTSSDAFLARSMHVAVLCSLFHVLNRYQLQIISSNISQDMLAPFAAGRHSSRSARIWIYLVIEKSSWNTLQLSTCQPCTDPKTCRYSSHPGLIGPRNARSRRKSS